MSSTDNKIINLSSTDNKILEAKKIIEQRRASLDQKEKVTTQDNYIIIRFIKTINEFQSVIEKPKKKKGRGNINVNLNEVLNPPVDTNVNVNINPNLNTEPEARVIKKKVTKKMIFSHAAIVLVSRL